MSERQGKLTITERLILTYIGYKTNRNFKFFMNNETLAKAICCKTSSTKVMVNKLVREGYLIKSYDDKDRRQLSLSGREFMPLDGVNMGNIEKNILKHDAQDQEQWANYYKNELNEAQIRIESLRKDNTNLQNKLFNTELKVVQFEKLFSFLGCTKEQIDQMAKQIA